MLDLFQPAISVSNAGQLAVDLLIQSTCAAKVSNIWHEAFIPLIGAHPYKDDSTDLCTEFESKTRQTLILNAFVKSKNTLRVFFSISKLETIDLKSLLF